MKERHGPTRMSATPGLGVWASCGDYGLEHELVSCSPPSWAPPDEPWVVCVRCADFWPELPESVARAVVEEPTP